MTGYRVEPTGREDRWAFQVVRLDDGCVVGFHETEERAQTFADNGAVPLLVVPPPKVEVNQLDLFGVFS